MTNKGTLTGEHTLRNSAGVSDMELSMPVSVVIAGVSFPAGVHESPKAAKERATPVHVNTYLFRKLT